MLEAFRMPADMPPYQDDNVGLLIAAILFVVVIIAAVWIVFGWLLYRVGKRLNYEHCWLAWVPIGNNWMLVEISGKQNPVVWFAGLLLLNCGSWFSQALAKGPVRTTISLTAAVATAVITVLLWAAIAERRGRPSWWGILWIVPIADIVVMAMLGNKDQPVAYAPQGYPQQPYPQQPYPPQEYPQQPDPAQPYPPVSPDPEPGPDSPLPPAPPPATP